MPADTANNPTPARDQLRERLAERCLELCEIPSVTGDESKLVRHIEKWARGRGQFSRSEVQRRGNALVLGNPDDARPLLALVGHLDTVPPAADDAGVARDADRVIGLGASDMKGSIAVMQALCESLDRAAVHYNVVLVLYDAEEGPYDANGLQPLLDAYTWLRHADLAIVMEPTDNTLQLGCMGAMHARVTYSGRAAHSARPWQGDNAIHKAGKLLSTLQTRACPEVAVEGLLFREAMSVTMAAGGRARNVVPDQFELNLNVRFAPRLPVESAIERAKQEVLDLVGGTAEVTFVDVAPPGPVPMKNPMVAHLIELGGLQVLPKLAWTDVARLAAHGIDAVNFGPGMSAQAHQRGEWISAEAMTHAYEVMARFLTTPLGG